MKKILSLMLALAMIISVFTPIIANAEKLDPKEQLFNELRAKFEPIRSGTNADDAIAVVVAVLNNTENIYKNVTNNVEYKNYLNAKGITEATVKGIISVLDNNKELIKSIIKDTNLDYNSVSGQLDTLLQSLYNALPEETKNSINKYANRKDEKINVLTNVISALINEKIGSGNYSMKTNKWISFNLAVTDSQISTANKSISGKSDEPLKEIHKNIATSLLNSSVNVLSETLLNAAGKLLYETKLITKVEVDTEKPDSGSSTGGGGGSTSTTPSTPGTSTPDPVIEVPTEGAVIGTVGKEHATVTTSAKGTNVQVKEFETVKAIDALRKKAGADRDAVLVIKLDHVKGLDVKVSLPVKVVKALEEKKVDLKVVTSDVEFGLPKDALKETTIPTGAKLELRIAEVSKEVEVENADVKRVVELSLVIVKGSEETVVSTFDAPITVKVDIKGLGNNDKLAVYYLNEEDNTLEFVTGKIQDNKAVLVLEHFSKYVVVESNKTFTDIESHWSKLYVESMAAKNVVGGYDDGAFRPEGKVTRAEFAKMIINSLELKLEKYDGSFTDVKENDWHADYVATIVKLGVAGGYDDGTFKPNKEITRAEMAVILSNILDVEVEETEIEALLGQYKDVEAIPAWATEAIAKVAKAKIMQGVNDNFNAGNTTTRAESATAIYRVYNK
ncbi:S-layer homology domain-containing protein [Tissierella sp. MSJ-40]|uniref:S-layer homology domain-containing protein n=1 Tax=Tissierella simiarum TaxID=2841534 RepID=A0ABS6E1J0_9FIRM|nr:S-layer homology domain-containing protein [Tissierella simiarum]MBU5436769.1 S-layer homology domain-containing protein [Tissierella simiarum]